MSVKKVTFVLVSFSYYSQEDTRTKFPPSSGQVYFGILIFKMTAVHSRRKSKIDMVLQKIEES